MFQRLRLPGTEQDVDTQIATFAAAVSRRFGIDLSDSQRLQRWSVEHPAEFWALLAEYCDLFFVSPPTEIHSDDPMPKTRWFRGATLNYAQHLLDHPDAAATAIIEIDDRQTERRLTFAQLREQVGRCAAALDAMGVVTGDRVAAYLSNGIESVVVLLACAARGAIFTSGSPTMGWQAIVDRFAQVKPKVLFASDGYWNAGRHHPSDLPQLATALGSLQHVVCIPSQGNHCGSFPAWSEVVENATSALRFEPLPFDHPIYILYTSGTTGLPKCIVHRAGGALLTHIKEQRLHCDIRVADVVFYQTNTGWMMWNWLVTALASRATIVLHGGGLLYPSREALWHLADRLGITHFGTSASHIHGCMRIAMRPRNFVKLRALRCVLSTGSPLSLEGFEWVYSSVKKEVHLASISGGTDIVGCFVIGDPSRAVRPGYIQGPALGVDLCAYDEQGNVVVGKPGELICRQPLPSMPIAFWNDPGDAKYREAYLARFPGVWCHGDRIEITEEGDITVWGRSDATLKPGGVRIGTGEIYRALEAQPEVLDALAAGKQDGYDVAIWLFVVLQPGLTLDRELRQRLSNAIQNRTTPQHVPRSIFQVNDLPRTHNGKLMELAVTRVINRQAIENPLAIANPQSLLELESIAASASIS